MNKNFLQDVMPPTQKRSIRDIPLPSHRKIPSENLPPQRIIETPRPIENTTPPNIPPQEPPRRFNNEFPMNRKSPNMKKIIIGASVVLVLIVVFVAMNIFSGAELKIVPKQAEAVINENIMAVSDSNASSTSSQLVYKSIEISKDVTETVKASGEEEVETKASGTITIFNNFDSKNQTLVKNTRFETPEGLIYRIDKSVTIPGQKEVNGTKQPGSVDAEVFADSTGEEYNIEKSSFTIPGFEGTPQFDGFSAQTKTALTGGFKGIRAVVATADLEKSVTSLKEKVTAELKAEIEKQPGENMIVIFDESSITFSEPKQKTNGDSVDITITGKINALVFDESKFSNYLAGSVLTVFNQSDNVILSNKGDLAFKIVTPEAESQTTNTTINVTGKANFIWKTDHELLKQSLAGKSKKDLKDILQDFNSIAKAESVIKPFWKSSFPDDLKKIKITESNQ